MLKGDNPTIGWAENRSKNFFFKMIYVKYQIKVLCNTVIMQFISSKSDQN